MATKLLAGELTWKQTRFIENYISNGGNATLAYMDAGYAPKAAQECSSRLLSNAIIKERIQQERERLQNLLNFKREDALRILIGMATASVDDFSAVMKSYKDRESYKDLGAKRFALKSVKKTKEGIDIQLVDKKEIINELWDKLGLGKGVGEGNWFDGFEQLAGLIRGTKKTE